MDINFNVSTIVTKRNTDSNGNPMSVKLVEFRQVMNNHCCVVLSQIPDETYRVLIDGYTEVFDIEMLDKKSFKVDYAQGVIYFHPFNVGKGLSIEYYGIGYEMISASRIFCKLDKYGRTVETLEEVLDRSKMQLDLVESAGNALHIIEEFKENVKSANNLNAYFDENLPNITNVKNQLNSLVTEATKWKDQLHTDVSEGKVLSPILQNDVIEANIAKEQLEQSITNAQDDIATINSTGNETVTVLASEWIYNDESKMYEKTITHNCASENIHITCKTSDTKDALFLPWRIIDKSKILLKSDEAISCVLVLSARFYKAVQTISDDIAQEVLEGRQGKSNLLTNMNRKINYENFTGNSIN